MNFRLDGPSAQKIFDRVAAGETQKNLAAEFQVSPSTISNLVAGKSWPHLRRSPVPKTRRGTKLTTADVTVILQRLLAGETPNQVAMGYGVSRQAVANIKKGKAWGEVPRPEVVVPRPTRRKVWET